MVFKSRGVRVFWTKVASALERLKYNSELIFEN